MKKTIKQASGKNNKWYMAGTEGTGKYVVIASSALGRVGFRDLGGSVRVRVEPTNAEKAKDMAGTFAGWKQPDKQLRFSLVVSGKKDVNKAVKLALKSIAGILKVNPAAPDWAKALLPA
jgi:hypothetical protein